MNQPPYIYHTVASVPTIGNVSVGPEAKDGLRLAAKRYPKARFAAAQCVDMSSRDIGHVTFVAVGPDNTIKTVDSQTLLHWSRRFIGFVNLDTWQIEPATI